MINSVLDSLTKQLGDTFGKKYKYYKENVEQKLVRPCFTVDVLNPIKRSYNPKEYYLTVPCVIHYFTDNDKTPKADAYNMGEQLLECLEYLAHAGRLIRGEDMSYTLVDDVLEVFITYRFYTETVLDKEDDMAELSGVNISQRSVN